MAGVWTGWTPLSNQYSGRHISYSNSLTSVVSYATAVVIGRIQVGPPVGGSAQVIVPLCCGPAAAAGIVPNEPPGPVGCVLLVVVVQAVIVVAPVSASAVITRLGRAILIDRLPPGLSS